uniref:hypothetical protein n=1 Tax=Pseudomonas laurentiana TaxID=2364649 RepID=UPI0029C92366|nr:hypothetical protein [Pseudomonas laurentiana]
MKRFLLPAVLALIASSAIAGDDMSQCELNLQKLRDLKASIAVVPEPLLSEVQTLRMNAEDARDNKDAQKCLGYTLQALQKLRTAGKT